MTTPDPSPPAAGAARRKLLRGAFALPAVAAVHSGAAVAASNLRCLANGPTAASAPPVIRGNQSETPQYLRTNLAVFSKTVGTDTSYRYYVDGAGLHALAAMRGVGVHASLITSAGYRRFRVNASASDYNQIVGSEVLQSTIETDGWTLQPSPLDNRRRLAVLMFDSSGTTIVGVGKTTVGTGGANAATESCWTSFSV